MRNFAAAKASLVFLKSYWEPVLTFSAKTHLNFQINLLKIKIRKEHKNTLCGLSRIFRNISWTINICLKYFMAPTPTYLMHSPLTYFWTKSEWSVHNFKSSNQSYSGNVKITFCRFLEIKTESIKKWHQYVNKIR